MFHRFLSRTLELALVAAPILALPAGAVALSPAPAAAPVAAPAQKLARKYADCASEGFKFKPLAKFEAIPVNGQGDEVMKFGNDQDSIRIFSAGAQAVESESKKGESVAGGARRSVESIVESFGYLGMTKKVLREPAIDEDVEVAGLRARHRQYNWEIRKGTPAVLDVWTYPMSHADIHICYFLLTEADKKVTKALSKSALSFKLIDRVKDLEIDTSERTYEAQLAWAEQQAAKTKGWEAIGTPSKRFVILTNSKKANFIKEIVERLEVSRDIYEKDFPPPANFKAVSIVRICASHEEFMKFANVSDPGVAGFFNPRSVELVLYDAVETDRNMTYAVVSHEAFHQYCHFLFNQSEAHRWFDEGHGDYYGGMKIKGKRGKITPKMPAGLDRLGVIREMVREETYVPFKKHLYFNHGQWQNQGPSGVSCYAQSWSLIYMLRQGALGNVSRKVWKKEYADIVPNYVRVLNQGFEDAYEELRQDIIKKAKKKGEDLDPSEVVVNRFLLDPRETKKIWKKAMEASWGNINIDEFEENWKIYVKKMIK